ncbi:alpha/beta hydrolase family protein [Paenibacillus chungangensis]|uniref:Alpha/beta hydrolase family protein n=1 Tax=Paenibacillus chungangensis TaxID=696535 RepID=A0ABW3HQF6_9BACL
MSYQLSQLSEETFPHLLNGIADPTAWEAKRDRIAEVWRQYIGWMPDRVPSSYTVHSEHREGDHIRIHLSYETAYRDLVYAYLLIPIKNAASESTESQRYPAVLALHPTDSRGKADIALSTGREGRQYALELVTRGYVVLAPDTIAAGERIYPGTAAFQTAPFYEQFPESTAVGKMIHDHKQGIDLLQSLPYVDPDRIGAIGHSLGAYNAYFLAAMDDRIKAVVSSCGFCPFLYDPDPNRWGQRDWFSHFPRLTNAIQEDRIPFEFHEIMALMAPTPIFNWFAQQDKIFPNWHAAAFASMDIHRLYQWMGRADAYISLMGCEGHDFPKHIRPVSYQFLDHWLRNYDV